MWKCPICSNKEKNEYICQNCGYDIRRDFVRYKTLCPVPKKDVEAWNNNVLQHTKKNSLDNALERKLPVADEIERHDRIKETADKSKQSVSLKSKRQSGSWPKKIAVVFIAMSIFGSVMGISQNVKSQNEQKQQQEDMSMAWNNLKSESVHALKNDYMNYETDTMESFCGTLENRGYYVSWPGDLPENMQPGTMISLRMNSQLHDDHSSYELRIDDWYGAEATQWHEREIYYNDSRRYDDFVENAAMSELHHQMSMLPYGIELGDTFDEVYDKLGLNEDMIAYAANSVSTVYVSITVPGDPESVGDDGSISIIFDEYMFSYHFSSNNGELCSYYVQILK